MLDSFNINLTNEILQNDDFTVSLIRNEHPGAYSRTMNITTVIKPFKIQEVIMLKKMTKVMVFLHLMSIGAAQAASDTAVITITGRVLANTCTIDTGSANQTITLPPISIGDVKATGAVNHALTAVPIILKNCGGSVTSVVVNASGIPHGVNGNAFDNTIAMGTTGRAMGLGVYFYHTNKSNLFYPNGSSAETILLTPSVDNHLTFWTTYGVVRTPVTPGDISSVINMTFDYQ